MNNTKHLKVLTGIFVVIVIGAVFAGCLNGDDDDIPTLTQTGSSTVLPLGIAWAEEYEGADISVSGGGSSHGINSLLNKEADLGDASRLMKGKEFRLI